MDRLDTAKPDAPSERLTREQQRLVARHADRVTEIARGIRSQVGTLPLEDFVSAGNEALVKAALRFDPAAGVPFTGYAYLRVRGAMIDAVRSANPTVRRQRRAMRAMAATQALYEEEQRKAKAGAGGDPRSLKERVEAAAELIRKTTAAVLLSKATPADPEVTGDPTNTAADEALIDAETRTRLRAAIDRCTAAERAMVEALYDRERSMHEYAAELGVNVSTVSRRHAKLLRKLDGILRDDGGAARTRAPPG
ncbi:MAG: sigma-70 family RNA polymerase sigma factor [Nannocystaceae bacterium]